MKAWSIYHGNVVIREVEMTREEIERFFQSAISHIPADVAPWSVINQVRALALSAAPLAGMIPQLSVAADAPAVIVDANGETVLVACGPGDDKADAELAALIVALVNRSAAPLAEWRPMVDAPLDGTEIEILIRHHSYWSALKTQGKAEADSVWQGPVRGKWIDFNGGGWTHNGMAGSPMGWRPLPGKEE